MPVVHPLQVVIVRLLVGGRALRAALRVGGRQRQLERRDDSARNLVLDHEHVLDVLLEGLGPDVIAGGDIDQAHVDAHLVAGSLDTAVEDILRAQLLSSLLRIDLLILESKDRSTGDDREALQSSTDR